VRSSRSRRGLYFQSKGLTQPQHEATMTWTPYLAQLWGRGVQEEQHSHSIAESEHVVQNMDQGGADGSDTTVCIACEEADCECSGRDTGRTYCGGQMCICSMPDEEGQGRSQERAVGDVCTLEEYHALGRGHSQGAARSQMGD
jgi:hypothetical protein